MRQQILVAEDDDLIRLSMVDVLRDLNFQIFEVASAEEALHLLAQFENIAVLIADVRLAGQLTGLELVQRARASHPRMRSFVVSGQGTLADACYAGANGFLRKPFTAEMLTSIVTVGSLHRKIPQNAACS